MLPADWEANLRASFGTWSPRIRAPSCSLDFVNQSRATGLRRALRNGTVIDHIHRIEVEEGNAVFLPAGRVHAIGAGNLLIEIQQNSDTTYRAFDWNRTDPTTGTKRHLHVEQAIQSSISKTCSRD